MGTYFDWMHIHKKLAIAFIWVYLTCLYAAATMSVTEAQSDVRDLYVSNTASRLSKGHIIFVCLPKYDNLVPLKHLARNLYDRGYSVAISLPEVRLIRYPIESMQQFSLIAVAFIVCSTLDERSSQCGLDSLEKRSQVRKAKCYRAGHELQCVPEL